MSLLIKDVLREIEQLTLAEQIQVLEHLVKQIKQSVAVPAKLKHKLSEFRGLGERVMRMGKNGICY